VNILLLSLRAAAAALLAVFLWQALPADLGAPAAAAAIAIIPLYIAAHALRALRLFLILYDGDLRLRDALLAHLHAAGVSALIPFKLGEVYRVLTLHGFAVRLPLAAVAIWIERVFDALLVAGLLGIVAAVAGPAAVAGAARFLAMLAAFLFASILLFLVLPENLVLVKRHLIRKHNNPAALALLQLADSLHRVLADASEIWRTRFATILWLSLGIWALEAGCVLAAVAIASGRPEAAASGARILSDVVVRSSPWTLDSATSAVLACYRLGTVDLLALAALAIVALAPFPQAIRTRPGRQEALWA
jgi:hypothetical protein